MTYEIRKLREVFASKKGRKPELHAAKKPGDVPYLVAKVMRGAQEPEWVRRDDPTAVHVTEDEAIIICDGSNSGEVFSGFSGALSSTMAKIEPKVPIDQTYLRRFLESNAELFAGTKTGTAIPHLDQDAMFNLEIPLPPLAEQQRIVRLLDEVFEGIAIAKSNAEKNLQNARALFESQLKVVFAQGETGWQQEALSKVTQLISDGTHHSPKVQHRDAGVGLFPYVTSKNIRNNQMDLANITFVDAAFHKEVYARCWPELGDVLLTKDGANTGNVALNTLEGPFSLLSSVCLIKTDETKLLPGFLCYYLQSPIGLSAMIGQMSGTAIKRIVLRDIRSARVPIPPLDVQRQTALKLDQMLQHSNHLKVIYQQTEDQLKRLEASMLAQAFSGNLKAA